MNRVIYVKRVATKFGTDLSYLGFIIPLVLHASDTADFSMDDQDGDLIDLLDLSQQLRELDDPLEHGSRHRERTLRHAPILILIFIFIAGLGDALVQKISVITQ